MWSSQEVREVQSRLHVKSSQDLRPYETVVARSTMDVKNAIQGDAMPDGTTFVLDTNDERELVAALTRDVLREAAPEEMALFVGDEAGWLNGRPGTATGSVADQQLGFGVEVLVPLTPYIVAAASAVVRFVAGALADIAKDEAKPVIVNWVHRIFGRRGTGRAGTPEPAVLPREVLNRVHEIAFLTCQERGLDTDDARLISDVIIGRLATTA